MTRTRSGALVRTVLLAAPVAGALDIGVATQTNPSSRARRLIRPDHGRVMLSGRKPYMRRVPFRLPE
ncbi:MAG: hypothetical protein KL785_00375 [Brevundimonas sp.]|nr:hypothetical protein [Brevundimonas sp.]